MAKVQHLEDQEKVIYEDELYRLTERPAEYGDGMSTFTIYDAATGGYIDEFDDLALTEEDLKNVEKTDAYGIFLECIEDYEKGVYKDWDMWDRYYDFTSKGGWDKLPAPKELTPEEKAAKEKERRDLIESLCKSDTIVFHETDKTTVMLDPIYEGRGFDVYKESMWGGTLTREDIHELIQRHDKIMCLGHGSPSGLMSGIIGIQEADLLKDKKVFALWCYAATYFKKNGFAGHGVFCSDNCPSEVWECRAACGADVSAEWIYNNMFYLSDCLKDVIDICWDNPEEACRIAREKYSQSKATTDDEKKVVEFNTNTLQVV